MRPLLIALACLSPLAAQASEDIADKYPASELYDKPVEVIPHVWSAIGATAPPTYENAGHNNNLSFIVTGDGVVVVNGGASARLAAAQAGVARDRAISFDLPSTGLAAQKLVLRARDLGVGQAGRALLPPLSFELRGPERVRLSGANGSGKSTLLRQIAGRLPPLSGRIERPVDSVYLDQRLSHLGQAGDVLSLARRTLPEMGEQDCRALLARLLFRNREALKPLAGLSGGERLRLGLALTLGRARPPQLVLLDEPTNHLDLAAIAAVERALGEYDGALIFVTHDSAFAAALAPAREIAIASGRVSDRGLA